MIEPRNRKDVLSSLLDLLRDRHPDHLADVVEELARVGESTIALEILCDNLLEAAMAPETREALVSTCKFFGIDAIHWSNYEKADE